MGQEAEQSEQAVVLTFKPTLSDMLLPARACLDKSPWPSNQCYKLTTRHPIMSLGGAFQNQTLPGLSHGTKSTAAEQSWPLKQLPELYKVQNPPANILLHLTLNEPLAPPTMRRDAEGGSMILG